MSDYLLLLSICQTCHYKGVSFLKFLLSRERDVDAFSDRPHRKRQSPTIEVYPKGFIPSHLAYQHKKNYIPISAKKNNLLLAFCLGRRLDLVHSDDQRPSQGLACASSRAAAHISETLAFRPRCGGSPPCAPGRK